MNISGVSKGPSPKGMKDNVFREIGLIIRRYLKWYLYPLVYFFITFLVCAYAWLSRPLDHRAGVRVIFETISLIPALVWSGTVTLWILVVITSFLISFHLKGRFPAFERMAGRERSPKNERNDLAGTSVPGRPKAAGEPLARKFSGYVISLLGGALIFAGIVLAVWVSRPYIALLLSSSKIEQLEYRVKQGQFRGDRIVIPSVLVDAPILEGSNKTNLSRGVCHVSISPVPGSGGNCIIEGHNLAEFGWWKPQSFFSMLEMIEEGTPIYVYYKGKKYSYRVKEKTYKNTDDPNLYDLTPGERLTLVTCVSTWSPTIYTNRRTVVLADPDPR